MQIEREGGGVYIKSSVGLCVGGWVGVRVCFMILNWWLASILGMFEYSFPARASFFFFLIEISARTLIALFTPGLVHSGSAN